MRVLVGQIFQRVCRWRSIGSTPVEPKIVIVCAPHTSNWDFVYMLAYAMARGLDIHWLGKHTRFEGAFGKVLRRFGGLPVDRRRPTGLVHDLVDEYWKSGFYQIALAAEVPVAMGSVDFAR